MISPRQRLAQLLAQRQDLTLGDAVEFINGLTPVMDVMHLDPEEWFLAGIQPFMGIVSQAAVAAQNAHCQVWNNSLLPTSLAIVVVNWFHVRPGAADLVDMGPSAFALTGFIGTTLQRDTQWSPTIAGAVVTDVQLRSISDVGPLGFAIAGTVFVPADGKEFLGLPIILAPQTGWTWQNQTVNQLLRVNVAGYKVNLRVR